MYKEILEKGLNKFISKNENIQNPTKYDYARVLNLYKDHLRCRTASSKVKKAYRNYIKVSIDNFTVSSIIQEFLFTQIHSRKVPLNFNGVETNELGQDETVLDYINHEITDGNHTQSFIDELESIKESMILRGAKTSAELLAEKRKEMNAL